MYSVCVDENLKVIATFPNESQARRYAKERKQQFPATIYFVANPSGMIVAGY